MEFSIMATLEEYDEESHGPGTETKLRMSQKKNANSKVANSLNSTRAMKDKTTHFLVQTL